MKRIGILFKYTGLSLAILLFLVITAIFVKRTYSAEKTKIKTKNGIQESIYVKIGGIEQYLQIRGKDKDNPVIVFLHGGPASPMSFVSYYYETELEADYTFINWDQRGCGRTYYKNPGMSMKNELSADILINDLDELVEYIKERFGAEKVIIMGHSWGTVLGTLYAKQHPEKVSAYIGVSQVVDFKEGKLLAANRAIELQAGKGNRKAAERLTTILNKFTETKSCEDLDIKNFVKLINLTLKYIPYKGAISPLKTMWLGLSSPDTAINDIRWFLFLSDFRQYFAMERPLMEEMFFNFKLKEQGDFEVPMYFISGENDWITPCKMVEEYIASTPTPDKILTVKNAGHSPFMDNPKDFAEAVKSALENIE
jgi:pimeloyl-ACP methyl ester carboxylesterase